MKLSRLQLSLISLNLLGLIAISYLLLTREQDWSRLRGAKDAQPIQTETKTPATPNPTKLMPRRNHSYAAAVYAYDVTEIQAYLLGQASYTGDNLVFITIDDGASDNITPALLDLLKQEGVPATFFPIGNDVTPDKASIYSRQIQEGHAIGLHSYSHDLDLLYPYRVPDTQQILLEAEQAEKAFKRILGMAFQSRVWRYPGGALSWWGLEETHAGLAEQGLTWIDWNASLGDAEPYYRRPETVDEMIAFHTYSLNHFPNSPDNLKVLLLHDSKDKQLTLEALPYIIQYYKDNGYRFGVLY